MTLSNVQPGEMIEIISIPDEKIRVQAIRLGIYEGAHLQCADKISNGPVILRRKTQEMAIGYGLSKQIKIKVIA
ncbi:MAG: ferrous iron transport protein A [Epulopiscium sp.]|nr:ferrous iron transport protein A [Candidatus Epulonipiscium sp.]